MPPQQPRSIRATEPGWPSPLFALSADGRSSGFTEASPQNTWASTQTRSLRSGRFSPCAASSAAVAPRPAIPAGESATFATSSVQSGPVTKRTCRTPPVSAALPLTAASTTPAQSLMKGAVSW